MERSEEVWPDAAGVDIWVERTVHAVTVVRAGSGLARLDHLHAKLHPEGLPAVEQLPVLLVEDVLGEEDLVGAAPGGTAVRGWPGAGLETPTEPVLSIVALVVVREETASNSRQSDRATGQLSGLTWLR